MDRIRRLLGYKTQLEMLARQDEGGGSFRNNRQTPFQQIAGQRTGSSSSIPLSQRSFMSTMAISAQVQSSWLMSRLMAR